tara:strand:+ start:1869 stop:2111 length:243 start_codon:yes stop_codon:yes gene_type:complete
MGVAEYHTPQTFAALLVQPIQQFQGTYNAVSVEPGAMHLNKGMMGRQQYVPRLRACYGLRQGLSINFGNQRFRLVVFVTV